MLKPKIALSCAVAFVIIGSIAFGTDFYVDAEAGSDSNSGTSADSAWLTITHALSSVTGSSSDPATVHIAAGTYSASTNGETFPLEMRSCVSLVGAAADTTMLDAEGNAHHVIVCSHLGNGDYDSAVHYTGQRGIRRHRDLL
ncbi:MAG TPA: DUF1565 domain-containing protein [bacterium]|nr:DUF1565 domain-containing protein [bacterium]